jgi:hypothetical protein
MATVRIPIGFGVLGLMLIVAEALIYAASRRRRQLLGCCLRRGGWGRPHISSNTRTAELERGSRW